MAGIAIPAAGLALFGAYRLYKGKSLHLPGHNYIGPGTDLNNNQDPVDQDDLVAKAHDLGYGELIKELHKENLNSQEFFDRVQELDTRATYSFIDDFQKTGNWHSLIGAIGLTLKKGGEAAVGKSIYPRYSK